MSPNNMTVLESRTLIISCAVSGTPTPDVIWFYRGNVLNTHNNPRMRTLDRGMKLELTDVDVEDSGLYSCKATNIAGDMESLFEVNVWGKVTTSALPS